MPKVGGVSYPYTKKGKEDAKKAKAKVKSKKPSKKVKPKHKGIAIVISMGKKKRGSKCPA
tara:strand:- start:659 stop:838 length:180 start_codon:yes stop_codon:yes gene_type:complete